MQDYDFIQIDELIKPKSGLREVYVDYYWFVTKSNEVKRTKTGTFQCNKSKVLMERLEHLHPDCDIIQIPLIFI